MMTNSATPTYGPSAAELLGQRFLLKVGEGFFIVVFTINSAGMSEAGNYVHWFVGKSIGWLAPRNKPGLL